MRDSAHGMSNDYIYNIYYKNISDDYKKLTKPLNI